MAKIENSESQKLTPPERICDKGESRAVKTSENFVVVPTVLQPQTSQNCLMPNVSWQYSHYILKYIETFFLVYNIFNSYTKNEQF